MVRATRRAAARGASSGRRTTRVVPACAEHPERRQRAWPTQRRTTRFPDVRATIVLARLIKQKQPRLWDLCPQAAPQGRGDRRDRAAARGLPARLGHVCGRAWLPRCGVMLAPHPDQQERADRLGPGGRPEQLFALDAAAIRERMFTRADELPEGVQRLPLKTIHLNKSPVVVGNLKTFSPALAERWRRRGAGAARRGGGGRAPAASPACGARCSMARGGAGHRRRRGSLRRLVGNSDRGWLQRCASSRPSNFRASARLDDAAGGDRIRLPRAQLSADAVGRRTAALGTAPRRAPHGDAMQSYFDRIDAPQRERQMKTARRSGRSVRLGRTDRTGDVSPR